MNTKCRSDWDAFVKSVCIQIRQGRSFAEVSELYGEKTMIWTGVIQNKMLDDADPGVQLQMPPTHVALEDGTDGVIDYLYARVATDNIDSWMAVPVGSHVRFEVTLKGSEGVFPGIEWSELGTKEWCLLLGTKNARLLDVLDI